MVLLPFFPNPSGSGRQLLVPREPSSSPRRRFASARRCPPSRRFRPIPPIRVPRRSPLPPIRESACGWHAMEEIRSGQPRSRTAAEASDASLVRLPDDILVERRRKNHLAAVRGAFRAAPLRFIDRVASTDWLPGECAAPERARLRADPSLFVVAAARRVAPRYQHRRFGVSLSSNDRAAATPFAARRYRCVVPVATARRQPTARAEQRVEQRDHLVPTIE